MSKKIEATHLKKIELNSAPLKAAGAVSHCITSTSALFTVARPIQSCPSSISPNASISPQLKHLNGNVQDVVHINEPKTIINNRDTVSEESSSGVLSCIPVNQQYRSTSEQEQKTYKKDLLTEQDKCNREPSKGKSHSYRDVPNHHSKEKTEKNRHRRDLSSEDEKYRKDRHRHKKYAAKSSSPCQRSLSRERARERRSFTREREKDERCSHGHKSASKKQKHQKRSLSSQRNSWSR